MADDTVAAPEMGWTSLTQAEVRSIKLYVTRGAAYADQVSLGFAIRLSQLGEELAEDHIVLRELDVLEGIASNSSTKAATQFEERPFLCIRFGTSISPRPAGWLTLIVVQKLFALFNASQRPPFGESFEARPEIRHSKSTQFCVISTNGAHPACRERITSDRTSLKEEAQYIH